MFEVFKNSVLNVILEGMTTTEPIVIPRSELPEVVVTNHGSGYAFRLKEGSPVDATSRQKALEYLALAEAIDAHHAARAKADDEKKLNDEANALSKAYGRFLGMGGPLTEQWEAVARAARELHGK